MSMISLENKSYFSRNITQAHLREDTLKTLLNTSFRNFYCYATKLDKIVIFFCVSISSEHLQEEKRRYWHLCVDVWVNF